MAADAQVVYEVNLTIDRDAAEDFGAWLTPHISELLALPGFINCEWTERATKPFVVFVLGGPGAGKGTQCARIVEEKGYAHLSAGDLLRAERNSGSPDAELINSYIAEGRIVPVEITVKLIKRAIDEAFKNGTTRFAVDGFPRSFSNWAGWVEEMSDACVLGGCLFFDAPDEVLIPRIIERGRSSGRIDDNEAAIQKRLNTYRTETMPVVEMFRGRGIVRDIDGTPEQDAVWAQLVPLLEELEVKAEPVCWTCSYRLENQAALDVYFNEHAARLRGDGLARFSGRFSASRRVLTSRSTIARPPAAE